MRTLLAQKTKGECEVWKSLTPRSLRRDGEAQISFHCRYVLEYQNYHSTLHLILFITKQ